MGAMIFVGILILVFGIAAFAFTMGYVRGELTAYRRVNKTLRNSPRDFREWQLDDLFDRHRTVRRNGDSVRL
jgi:hypothetical protein